MTAEWNGCRLVNPYCPADLCVLPPDDAAHARGMHQLATMPAPEVFGPDWPMAPEANTARELVAFGWRLAVP